MNDPAVPTPPSDDLDAYTLDAATIESGARPADVEHESIDLDAIARDLSDVQTALERLNDGSYWTDEVTGEAIPDDVLAARPTARTVSPRLA